MQKTKNWHQKLFNRQFWRETSYFATVVTFRHERFDCGHKMWYVTSVEPQQVTNIADSNSSSENTNSAGDSSDFQGARG